MPPDQTRALPDPSALEEREQRKGWVVNDAGECQEVVGYFCDNPADPERKYPMWWCPAYGYSVPESTLYPNHLSAAREALRLARLKRDQANVQIGRYEMAVEALGGDPSAL